MTDDPPPLSALLQRQLATTPVGRDELREPQSGLSLPQRWLLRRLDGQATLADLAQQPGCPAVERLPRDAARLVSLGLARDVGDPGPLPPSFGPTTQMGDSTLTLSLDDLAPPPPAHTPPAAPAGAEPAMARRLALPMGVVLLAGAGVLAGAAWWLRSAAAPQVAPAHPGLSAQAATVLPGLAPVAATPALPAASAEAAPASAAATTQVPGPVPALVITAPDPAASARAAVAPFAASRPPPVPPTPPAQLEAASVRSPAAVAVAPPSPAPGTAVAPDPAYAAPTVAPAVAPTAPSAVAPATGAYPPPAAVANPAPPVAVTAPVPIPTTVTPLAGVPPVTVTSAGPPPAAAVAPLRPTSVVDPVFPREALGGGGREVLLQARLTVAPNGTVTQVTFAGNSNSTQRLFERAARNALLQWRFPEGPTERTYVQSMRFREE